jgi:WD40 repeat protein
VDSVAFAPDGKTLASGCKDRTIKLWDARTGKLLRTLTGHTGRVESLAFSPDGRLLATAGGGGDTSVRLWQFLGARQQ